MPIVTVDINGFPLASPDDKTVSRRNELKCVAGLSFALLVAMSVYCLYSGIFKGPNADVLCVSAGDGDCGENISCKTLSPQSSMFNGTNVTFTPGFILAACEYLQSQCNLENTQINMTLLGMWQNNTVSEPVTGKCVVDYDAFRIAIALGSSVAVVAFASLGWFIHLCLEGRKEAILIGNYRRDSGLLP